MASAELETRPSPSDLLKAVERLPLQELDEFVDGVLLLRARRVAPHLTKAESELLGVIYEPMLAEEMRPRYEELKEKLRAETLTGEEPSELIRINDLIESRNVVRVQALIDLARHRQVSVEALMRRLGIQAPPYE